MVVGAILDNLCQKVFDEIMAREDIPTEFGDREGLTKAGEKLQRAFKEQLTRARMEEGWRFLSRLQNNYYFKCDIIITKTRMYTFRKQNMTKRSPMNRLWNKQTT